MYTVLDGKARGARAALLIAPVATGYHFRMLDNFWLLEYEIGNLSNAKEPA